MDFLVGLVGHDILTFTAGQVLFAVFRHQLLIETDQLWCEINFKSSLVYVVIHIFSQHRAHPCREILEDHILSSLLQRTLEVNLLWDTFTVDHVHSEAITHSHLSTIVLTPGIQLSIGGQHTCVLVRGRKFLHF